MNRWLTPNAGFRRVMAVTAVSSTLLFGSTALAKDVGISAGRKIQIHASQGMSVNSNNLRDLVDTATAVTDKNPLTRKKAADLLYRTAMHESGGLKYSKQLGGGPARSVFQIEPTTATDIVQRWAKNKSQAMGALEEVTGMTRKQLLGLNRKELVGLLETNSLFATTVARFKYMMTPHAIPEGLVAQANYWGRHYQTSNSPKKIQRFITNNKQFTAQIQNAMKGNTLREGKTAGIVNRVLHQKKTNHAIKNLVKKTLHLFKV